MNERQFDRVTRHFAAGVARREVVRGLAGSILAGTLALLGRREVGAEPKKDTALLIGDRGCNKNYPCFEYFLTKPICYQGRCCVDGPSAGFGCNPEVSPNLSCCSGVCDPSTNQCTSV